jgi:hypothetical protein
MRLLGMVLIVAAVFVLGCGGGPALQQASQPITLEFRTAGDYINYVTDFGIDTNFGGSVISWLSTFDFKVKVDSITDKVAERRFEFHRFTVTTIQGDTPEPDANAPEYDGTTLWLQMDADGALKDWKGLDAIRGRTVDGRTFKEYIVYQLMGLFQPPKNQPVNSGSTWQNQFTMEMRAGAVETEYTTTIDYTVEGFAVRNGHECAKIDMAIRIDAVGSGSLGGKETSIKSEAAGDGVIWFDYVNGIIVEYSKKTTTTRETLTERAGKEDITSQAITLDTDVRIRLKE